VSEHRSAEGARSGAIGGGVSEHRSAEGARSGAIGGGVSEHRSAEGARSGAIGGGVSEHRSAEGARSGAIGGGVSEHRSAEGGLSEHCGSSEVTDSANGEPLRWLITGAKGQLGTDLQRELEAAAVDPAHIRAVGSADLDITDRAQVAATFEDFAPDIVINAAAYTAVDRAETDEDRAYAVNATGPALLAAEAARTGARLLHVSTDYVFAGDADTPYGISDPTGPRSAYGRTKLAGELAVRQLAPDSGYVVRTAWVYGVSGSNFVKTMVKLEGVHETLRVVADQRGSPTWSADLAQALVELARSHAPADIYHCTGSGETTWFEFTKAIFEELGADPVRVLATTSDNFPRPAPRPSYSVLSSVEWRAAGLTAMPHWRDALHKAFSDYGDAFRGKIQSEERA
jgi:dTDP-4-dehydrorhamnose reductase